MSPSLEPFGEKLSVNAQTCVERWLLMLREAFKDQGGCKIWQCTAAAFGLAIAVS